MENKKIQWHPAFVAAMDLEFSENRDDLIYEREYNLNTKPLEIDLLVIKKNKNISIANEIGKFFLGHNIMEFKSPGDHLNIDTFYKAGAYASLYKVSGTKTDAIKADDITVSIIRDIKPAGLFKYFSENGFKTENSYPGIYYILNNVLFPTQIIVTGELETKNHAWLAALSEHLQKHALETLLSKTKGLTSEYEQELADSVINVTMQANKKIIETWKEENNMYEALYEIMEPEISEIKRTILVTGREEGMREGRQEGLSIGLQKGRTEGILGTVAILRDLNMSDDKIIEAIMKQYNLSKNEAEVYLH